jgi:hypothetical protein
MSAEASSPTKRSTLVNSEKYIGLDVHQATIAVAVMDSRGKVVMESILETKAATLLEFLAGLAELCRSPSRKEPGRPGCMICSSHMFRS